MNPSPARPKDESPSNLQDTAINKFKESFDTYGMYRRRGPLRSVPINPLYFEMNSGWGLSGTSEFLSNKNINFKEGLFFSKPGSVGNQWNGTSEMDYLAKFGSTGGIEITDLHSKKVYVGGPNDQLVINKDGIPVVKNGFIETPLNQLQYSATHGAAPTTSESHVAPELNKLPKTNPDKLTPEDLRELRELETTIELPRRLDMRIYERGERR